MQANIESARRVLFLARTYLDGVEAEFGLLPIEPHDEKGFPNAFRPAWELMLEFAASEQTAATRKFNSNISPEQLVRTCPWACLFGAMRQAFIPIEPELQKYGWQWGVPFEALHAEIGGNPTHYAWVRAGNRTPPYEPEESPDDESVIRVEERILDDMQRQFREFGIAVDGMIRSTERDTTIESDATQYVTLDQIAAIVAKSKRTLEKWKSRKINPLPGPDIEGGGGKADEWNWARIRPWLEENTKRKLPDRYPSDRFRSANRN
jgi:hypothetical protein